MCTNVEYSAWPKVEAQSLVVFIFIVFCFYYFKIVGIIIFYFFLNFETLLWHLTFRERVILAIVFGHGGAHCEETVTDLRSLVSPTRFQIAGQYTEV